MPADSQSVRPKERVGDQEAVRRLAAAMQALSAPNRVRIIACLRESPRSVTELAEAVGLEQSAVSHHLRLLRDLGLVVCRRRGRRVMYALHRKHLRALFDEAFDQIERPSIGVNQATPRFHLEGRGAFDQGRRRTVTYIIAEPCIDIKDKSCVEVCPVDCIHEFDRMLVIDPDECIDCGACEPECPVEAIYPEDALPDKWAEFVKINYAYPDPSAINTLVEAYVSEHNVQNKPAAGD